MKIQAITWAHRNDFHAVMECEHCGHTAKLTSGYNDGFYHERVIPAMHCASCGKNAAGETEHKDEGVSPVKL